MNIITCGMNDKVSYLELKKATLYFGRQLMTRRLGDALTIVVRSACDYDMHGSTIWLDDNLRPRKFSVIIKGSLSKRKQLITLAHEMVHVKQFAKGELKQMLRDNSMKWNGIPIARDMKYIERPWEIEAYGREMKLYESWREYRKDQKLKFSHLTSSFG